MTDINKVLAICTPFFILITIMNGFNWLGLIFVGIGIMAIIMWIKEHKLNKIKKVQLEEINQLLK